MPEYMHSFVRRAMDAFDDTIRMQFRSKIRKGPIDGGGHASMPSSEIVRDDLLHRDALEVFVDGAVGQGHSDHRYLRPRRRVTPIQSHPPSRGG